MSVCSREQTSRDHRCREKSFVICSLDMKAEIKWHYECASVSPM